MGLEVLGYPPGMERTPGGSQESPGTPQGANKNRPAPQRDYPGRCETGRSRFLVVLP